MMVEDVFMFGRHPVFELVENEDRQGEGSGSAILEEVQARQNRRHEGSLRSGRTAETRRRRLNMFKYKGKKRVFRSKGKRWDFTA